MNKVSYDFLWQTLQEESKNKTLNQLPQDFYSEAEQLLKEEKDADKRENINNNITNMISKIKEIRINKLLLYIAYGKQIQMPIPIEEQEAYERITAYIYEYRNRNKGENEPKALSVVHNVPEIYLPSGNKIGPLSEGQKIKINEKNDAAFLINSLICEYE